MAKNPREITITITRDTELGIILTLFSIMNLAFILDVALEIGIIEWGMSLVSTICCRFI